jgi:hypothetical protein
MSAQTAEIQRTLSAASLPGLLRNAITKPSAAKINQALSVTLTLVAHLGLQLLGPAALSGQGTILADARFVCSCLPGHFQPLSNQTRVRPESQETRPSCTAAPRRATVHHGITLHDDTVGFTDYPASTPTLWMEPRRRPCLCWMLALV